MAPAPDADGAASVVTEESGRAPRRAPAPKPAPAPPASVREHFSPKPARPANPSSRRRRYRRRSRRGSRWPSARRRRRPPARSSRPCSPPGDTVEIIWQKDTTLEVDGAGDRCIVASLRGPFPDKKKKRRSSTSLPAYHVYAELRSLVRLAGDQEHARRARGRDGPAAQALSTPVQALAARAGDGVAARRRRRRPTVVEIAIDLIAASYTSVQTAACLASFLRCSPLCKQRPAIALHSVSTTSLH